MGGPAAGRGARGGGAGRGPGERRGDGAARPGAAGDDPGGGAGDDDRAGRDHVLPDCWSAAASGVCLPCSGVWAVTTGVVVAMALGATWNDDLVAQQWDAIGEELAAIGFSTLHRPPGDPTVAIGAVRGHNRAPILVTKTMVENMKNGAVIIDLSIDNGGCFETSEITTHDKPILIKHGVIHYGVTNITSRFSRTSTKALSNFFLPYLLEVGHEGGFDCLISKDAGLRNGCYIFKGRHSNRELAEWFNLDFKDINLLML